MTDQKRTFHVPPDPAAVASARRFTEQCLELWCLTSLTETMNLLVTELVTNAVMHGGTGADVTLRLGDGGLRVEVRDGSVAEPRIKNFSETATTGRGLRIVDALADRWGADTKPEGKVVWFEVDFSGDVGEAVATGTLSAAAMSPGTEPGGPGELMSMEDDIDRQSKALLLVGAGC